MISLLQDEKSWIFLPEAIFVYYYDDAQKNYRPVGNEIFSHTEPGAKQSSIREIKPGSHISSQKLKLVLLPLKKIPEWHNGKGNHAWLFIDEIKVY